MLSSSAIAFSTPNVGRNDRYAGSAYGTTVLRPSFPPASSTTTRVRSSRPARCGPSVVDVALDEPDDEPPSRHTVRP
jgi:hypothetical protein